MIGLVRAWVTFIVPITMIFGCRQSIKSFDEIEHTENADFVNTFIGTGGHGHTFPGATTPYGMVQLSPDTRTVGWDACGGYHYSDSSIIGFSHTHLSGTGIADYGDVLFMPFSGVTQLTSGNAKDPDSGFRSRFSHHEESSQPGYYQVQLLDDQINAELTTTSRAGFHRYSYKNDSDKKLMIDLTHVLQERHNENVVNEFSVISDTELIGYKMTSGWAKKQHIYFHALFNQPFDVEFYNDTLLHGDDKSIKASRAKAVLTFKGEGSVLVKVGISVVDNEGARKNIEAEIPHWDFDKVKSEAFEKWSNQLSNIKIEGATEDQKTIFYTALYHTSISPNIFNDIDGKYRKMDMKIGQLPKGENMFTVFSLWDTFRAFHPLLTITNPDFDNELVKTLLRKYEEGGVLPKWELAANYTGTMIGYHAIPVIVDAYFKGIQDFDVEKAYQAMIHASNYNPEGIIAHDDRILDKLMAQAKKYNQQQEFIPADKDIEVVAKALEYAYDDWCIAQMAKDLGKEKDYDTYMNRSKRYSQYFDQETRFMRGKLSDGSWRTPFDPKASTHRKDDYCEGNAWQWIWFVPHDVEGLVDLIGGRKAFSDKLDTFFTMDSEITGNEISNDISGLIGQYAHGNEPGHHITHLYNYVGEPWKTQALVDTVLQTLYFNDPNGLAGNEDCGQMSAWYILNALGFYQVCPGSTEYTIGRPLFDKVRIDLSEDREFVIETLNNSTKNKYVQSVVLNGKELTGPMFDHSAIVDGGTLTIEMGPLPNRNFGK